MDALKKKYEEAVKEFQRQEEFVKQKEQTDNAVKQIVGSGGGNAGNRMDVKNFGGS